MTEHWSSARERELTKFYNARLRARRTDSAHAWPCQLTITPNWHLSYLPDDAPGAALSSAGARDAELAPPVQPAQAGEAGKEAPHGHP